MRKHSNPIMMLAATVLVALLSAAPVSAHHGWSQYQDAQFEITGTLSKGVSLAGPHGTAQISVGDDIWDIIFAPSSRTARAGLGEETVPVGATVTASGHRHRDVSKLEIKAERLTWNDTVFNVYPDRE